MLSGLILTAFLMGLGGIPHCAAMCGAPCAVAFPRGLPWLSLLGRCLGYAMLGALAAVSAGAVASLGREVAFLQPLWMMLLAAVLILGVYLVRSGQMPEAANQGAAALYKKARSRWLESRGRQLPPVLKPLVPLLAGVAWALMPCGLLYAAVMVAVLAPHAWGGAVVMLAFALPGAFGIWAAPALLRRISRLIQRPASAEKTAVANQSPATVPTQSVPITWFAREIATTSPKAWRGAEGRPLAATPHRPSPADRPAEQFDPRWAVRISGAMLAAMSAWALYHQLWAQWQIWCA